MSDSKPLFCPILGRELSLQEVYHPPLYARALTVVALAHVADAEFRAHTYLMSALEVYTFYGQVIRELYHYRQGNREQVGGLYSHLVVLAGRAGEEEKALAQAAVRGTPLELPLPGTAVRKDSVPHILRAAMARMHPADIPAMVVEGISSPPILSRMVLSSPSEAADSLVEKWSRLRRTHQNGVIKVLCRQLPRYADSIRAHLRDAGDPHE